MTEMEDPEVLRAEANRLERLGRSPTAERLAVLAAFDLDEVADLVAGGDGSDPLDDIADLLCEPLPSGEQVLADQPRIEALTRMLERGGVAELARVRRSVPTARDSALQRMLDAFVLGGPPLEDRDEDELVASLEVWGWATEAVARARLVGTVLVTPAKDAIESRLSLLKITRPVRRLADAGCLGREAELARLHAYRQPHAGPHDLAAQPAMVVHGIGGVGKSTLVARFVLDLYEERLDPTTGVFAYLDLDRPALASCAPDVLLGDIIEQVAAQRTDQRRRWARQAMVKRQRMRGAGLEAADTASSYHELALSFAREVRPEADGALVVVLDTYEQLERNRPDRAVDVYELCALLAAELPGFRLVVSGRTPAGVFVDPARPDRQLYLPMFRGEAALALLRHLVGQEAARTGLPAVEVDQVIGREIFGVVGGIPLTMRLAARVLVQEGPQVITDLSARAHAIEALRSEFVRGFLYQRILQHIRARGPGITTGELQRLARAGIVLRQLTLRLVEEVLVPALTPPPAASPAELFQELATEVAFADLEGGVLRLREELRTPALMALRIADPGLVQDIHQRAAAFYVRLPGEDALLELAYHRLALGAAPGEFDAVTLQRLAPVSEDLPPASAALVRKAGGVPEDAAAELAATRDLMAWERSVGPVAEAALREGRHAEVRQLLAERTERSATTQLHRLESRLAQARDDLTGAVTAAVRDLAAADAAGDAPRFAAAAMRLAGLHERTNAGSEGDRTLRRAEASGLLAGWPLLRLELLLNRMNLRERTGVGSAEDRWLLGLQARALMQRCMARDLTGSTALVRLMAAALGAEEPERIRAAARQVGLGHEEDPVRVGRLIDALADWDASLDPPGRLARASNIQLDGEDAESVRRAWSALAGLGIDAGRVLERAWAQLTPPADVLERLREVYLWWAVDDGAGERRTAVPAGPGDWPWPKLLALEEILLTAYPTSTDLLSLASRAGLDLSLMSWASSDRRIVREVIGLAARRGQLDDVVDAVLADPAAVSVHGSLSDLVNGARSPGENGPSTDPAG